MSFLGATKQGRVLNQVDISKQEQLDHRTAVHSNQSASKIDFDLNRFANPRQVFLNQGNPFENRLVASKMLLGLQAELSFVERFLQGG